MGTKPIIAPVPSPDSGVSTAMTDPQALSNLGNSLAGTTAERDIVIESTTAASCAQQCQIMIGRILAVQKQIGSADSGPVHLSPSWFGHTDSVAVMAGNLVATAANGTLASAWEMLDAHHQVLVTLLDALKAAGEAFQGADEESAKTLLRHTQAPGDALTTKEEGALQNSAPSAKPSVALWSTDTMAETLQPPGPSQATAVPNMAAVPVSTYMPQGQVIGRKVITWDQPDYGKYATGDNYGEAFVTVPIYGPPTDSAATYRPIFDNWYNDGAMFSVNGFPVMQPPTSPIGAPPGLPGMPPPGSPNLLGPPGTSGPSLARVTRRGAGLALPRGGVTPPLPAEHAI